MLKVKHILRFLLLCFALLFVWKAIEIATSSKSVLNNQINIKWDPQRPEEDQKAPEIVQKRAGLTVKKSKFYLDGSEVVIRAGSVNYFRMMPDYWLYTLTALKSSGLNTVESCVPWNVHENVRGKFNWRTMADIRQFVSVAKDLNLMVILRIGPYVNCDVDFGGLPGWLLSDANARVRSTSDSFLRAYNAYLSQLAYRIEDFQYSVGGNIIAFEVETDVTAFTDNKRVAEQYVAELAKIIRKNNLNEALFTSESSTNAITYADCSFALARDGAEAAANGFDTESWDAADRNMRSIKARYPNAPTFVTLYTGVRTSWGDVGRKGVNDETFRAIFDKAIANEANFVISMFAGSTNFNFLAAGAARPRQSAISSYDMDSLLSEYGSIRTKYDIVHDQLVGKMQLLSKAQTDALQPDLAAYRHHIKLYDTLSCSGVIPYERVVEYMVPEPIKSRDLGVTAEQLRIPSRNGDGATQGFVVYRTRIPAERAAKSRLILKVSGKMNDRLVVLVNYQMFNESDPGWAIEDERVDVRIDLTNAYAYQKHEDVVVDLLVENTGRANLAESGAARWITHSRKGFHPGASASINDASITDWLVYPLEFRPEFMQMLDRMRGEDVWDSHPRSGNGFYLGPALFKYSLRIERNIEPCDTFIEYNGYSHGLAFVNALGVGRYSATGPQRTLYVPGAVMRHDYWNKFYLFELHSSPGYIKLSDHANFR